MKKSKMLTMITICLVLVFALVGCSTNPNSTSSPSASAATSAAASAAPTSANSAAPSATPMPTFVINWGADQGTIDPAGKTSLTFWGYVNFGDEPLCELKPDGTYRWLAATSCDINQDTTQFTFHIDPKAKWSDGSPLVAADFVNTLKRALANTKNSYYASFAYCIKNAEAVAKGTADASTLGIETPDDHTLTFNLTAPTPYFLDLMTLPVFLASPSKYATTTDGDWEYDPSTSPADGPYCLEKYVPQQYMTLKRNPYYNHPELVGMDTVKMVFMADKTAALEAYKSGALDFCTMNGNSNVIKEYQGKPDLHTMPGNQTLYFLLNWASKPLDNVKVREALTLALNRSDMCTMLGPSTFPTTNFVAANLVSPLGKKWSDESGPMFTENVQKAQQLLADAGYPDGKGFPTLTLKYKSDNVTQQTCEIAQQQWQKNLGITVNLQAEESGVQFSDMLSGNYDITYTSWTADYPDPSTYLNMYVTNGTFNHANLSIPEYDSLITKANAETDKTMRDQLCHQAEKLLISDNFALIPLYGEEQIRLVNPNITNFVTDVGHAGFLKGYLKWK